MQRVCKQCRSMFIISESEEAFFKEKNLNMPKRCKACREANKLGIPRNDYNPVNPIRTNTRSNYSGNYYSGNYYSGNHNSSKNHSGNNSLFFKMLAVFAVVVIAIIAESQAKPFTLNQPADSGYVVGSNLTFRDEQSRLDHYYKHGEGMGYGSAEEYEAAAAAVVGNAATLHKNQASDGDDAYYLARTNEFVVVSTDGFIRTYFLPSDGIAYYNRQ